MQQSYRSLIISTGFAIFSMLFGAGNLMYPILVGITSCLNPMMGIMGFLFTSVLLPLMGLLAMVLYNGNYTAFFHRLGRNAGDWCIALCMIIIGPLIAIPRIVTLSHVMLAPFLPKAFLGDINQTSAGIFAALFLLLTFVATRKPSKIVDVLGLVISPLLMIALAIIIIKGIIIPGPIDCSSFSPINPWLLFYKNGVMGYETLDLLGTIFFSSIVIQLLASSSLKEIQSNVFKRAQICLISGLFGIGILSAVYFGLAAIGYYHGTTLPLTNAGQLFSDISFRILGINGALIIAVAVLMACLSTAIALGAVVSQYLQNRVLNGSVSFQTALIIVLAASMPLSIFGLSAVLKLTAGPILYIGYPGLIMLTICNILHKIWGFDWVKLPVTGTILLATLMYYFM